MGTLIGYLTQCSNWVPMGPILVIGYVTLWDTQFVGERSHDTNGPAPGKSDWRGGCNWADWLCHNEPSSPLWEIQYGQDDQEDTERKVKWYGEGYPAYHCTSHT